jgi:hypothetical protein
MQILQRRTPFAKDLGCLLRLLNCPRRFNLPFAQKAVSPALVKTCRWVNKSIKLFVLTLPRFLKLAVQSVVAC